jgi:hypothetical protein
MNILVQAQNTSTQRSLVREYRKGKGSGIPSRLGLLERTERPRMPGWNKGPHLGACDQVEKPQNEQR